MKKILLLSLFLISANAFAQDLNSRVTTFYTILPNTDFLEESYKQSVMAFISPITKLNRDSIASNYFSFWNAQNMINNKMTSFYIDSLSFNNNNDSAIVFTNQIWNLDSSEKFLYTVKSEWVKHEGAWYLSDRPWINIGIKPYNK